MPTLVPHVRGNQSAFAVFQLETSDLNENSAVSSVSSPLSPVVH